MSQGRITTVYANEARTVDACDFAPVRVELPQVVAEQSQTLHRPATALKSAVAAWWCRLGHAIKRYFSYNVEGKSPRVWELDVLRGFILIFVTIDHCLYYGGKDLLPVHTIVGYAFKELSAIYCASAVRKAMQPFGLWLLAFMAGVNCAFTRSKARRVVKFWIFCGLFMGGYALLHVIWPELVTATVVFNIIAVLTICFTVWWLLDTFKCSYWLRGYLGAFVIVVGLTYYYKYYVLDNAFVQNSLLSLMVYNDHGRALSPQNFEPLLPHLGFFLVGGVLGKYLYPDRKTKCKRTLPPKALGPVLIIGKHSLAAYLVLPFLILGILRGISALVELFM